LKNRSILAFFTIILLTAFTSCKKNDEISKGTFESDLKSLNADFMITGPGEFTKVITKRLINVDDCRYIVAGTIEYYKNSLVSGYKSNNVSCLEVSD